MEKTTTSRLRSLRRRSMRIWWMPGAPTLAAALIFAPGVEAQDGPCRSAVHDVARPLVGTWHEFTITPDGEVFEGELRSALEAGGCAFVQSFISADGAFTFQSLGHVDSDRGAWVEQFVLGDGRTAVYDWAREGSDILLNRRQSGPDRYRLRITDLGRNSYLVIEERQIAGASEWTSGERTMTRRVDAPGASPPPAPITQSQPDTDRWPNP
jgi:hypothetical protein